MENASKALLIAGAILIVILLIGVGMMVYNSAMGSISGALESMNTQEIQQFNQQFTVFEGKQKGTAVRSLISKVIANNSTYSNVAEKIVSVNSKNAANDLSALSSTIITSKTYTVTLTYDATGTLVSAISVN